MLGARGSGRGTAADPTEATIHKLNVIKHAASSEDARTQHFGKSSRRSKRCAPPVPEGRIQYAYVSDRQVRKALGVRIVPQAWTIQGRSAGCVPLRVLRSGGQRAPSETCGDDPRIARSPVETVARRMRLRALPEALEPGSIRSFLNITESVNKSREVVRAIKIRAHSRAPL